MLGQPRSIARYPLISLWLCFLFCANTSSYAQDQYQAAIDAALATHPTIAAAQANLAEASSNLKLAQQGRHPKIRLEGEMGRARTYQRSVGRTSTGGIASGSIPTATTTSTAPSVAQQSIRPKNRKAILEQPLYKGGQISAGIQAACAARDAATARLTLAKLNVVYEVTKIYMDVVVAQESLALYQKIEQVLGQHLAAAQLNFKLGNATRTDMAQAESRLSGAKADRLDAATRLQEAQAHFMKWVGYAPESLKFPIISIVLPDSATHAVAQSQCHNPELHILRADEHAAKATLDGARGELLPSLSLRAETSESDDTFFKNIKTRSSGIYANLSIPLYNSGGSLSKKDAARHALKKKGFLLLEKQREIEAQTKAAFVQTAAHSARIKARKDEVTAAQLALEGLKLEYKNGGRSMLDVLDGERESLGAHLNHLNARKEYVLSVQNLLRLMGEVSSTRMRGSS